VGLSISKGLVALCVKGEVNHVRFDQVEQGHTSGAVPPDQVKKSLWHKQGLKHTFVIVVTLKVYTNSYVFCD